MTRKHPESAIEMVNVGSMIGGGLVDENGQLVDNVEGTPDQGLNVYCRVCGAFAPLDDFEFWTSDCWPSDSVEV